MERRINLKTILVIDDEPSILTALDLALKKDYRVYTSADVPEAMSLVESKNIDLILLDQCLGEYHGLDVLENIKKINHNIIVIAMTAYGSIESSIKAMQLGAYYYITKPLDLGGLKILINKALEYKELSDEVESLKHSKQNEEDVDIIADSSKMRSVFEMIDKVRDIDINVLITGESGTGKDLIAKKIHYSSMRSENNISIINCAAIPSELLESELFGYEKGAFTGAEKSYKGKILEADGGTLFLDEIGDMDILLQAKLLRAIQDKKITPLGSTKQIPVDFRLITATNKNLEEEVEKGNFREDLFFRLNVINIKLPPLRDRKEDIPLLVKYFLDKYSKKFNKDIITVTYQAISILENYDYPGNIRELENIIERAVALSTNEFINVCDLPQFLLKNIDIAEENEWITLPIGKKMKDIEREYILATYEYSDKNKRKTAKMLGISERNLYNKLEEYQLNSEK